VRLLVASASVVIPRLEGVAVDARVLGFALAVALTTAVAFGLLPALFLSRADLQQMLKEAAGRGTGGGRARARRLLVVGEVALAVMLLFGAGLLIRTVGNLTREDPGLNPEGVLTASIQLAPAGYQRWEQVASFYAALLDRLRQSPEIQAAGVSNFLPLVPGWRVPFLLPGRPAPPSGQQPQVQYHSVSDGYFQTIGATIVSGRGFEARDVAAAQPVVIVNETFVRQHFPGENPVGATIISLAQQIGPLGRRLTTERNHQIVGVVRDVKNHSLQRPAEAAIYHTASQFPFRAMYLSVRGSGDPARLAPVVREALRALDPALPLSNVRPMSAVVADSVDQPRFLTYLMSGFAALALVLASVGICGMLAYAVSQRRQEISIRFALGATPGTVLWLVLRQGLILAAAGVAIGAAGGLVVGRWLESVLYGIGTTDPSTLATVIAVVLGVAAGACLLPAWRASALNPLAGLRQE
jgi:putative ABC transport system permease protein